MERSSADNLPPCRVCDAAATGIHYGVITCEACKAFFRRGLIRGDVYECAEKNCCDVSHSNRNNCAFCRFQKCIKVGMSKDAIKTGRHSYEMKTMALREARRKKLDQDRKSSDKQTTTSSTIHINESDNSANNPDINATIVYNSFLNNNLNPSTSAQFLSTMPHFPPDGEDCRMEVADVASVEASDTDSAVSFLHCTSDIPSSSFCSPDLLSSPDDVGRLETVQTTENAEVCAQDSVKLYYESKVDIYESYIKRMHDNHETIVKEDINMGAKLSPPEMEYLEMIELRKQVFGSLKVMTPQEYMSFYKETGIDIDGRRDLILQWMPIIEKGIKQHIEFSKTIPGFRDLNMNDQIALIKCARMDFFMISCHRCFSSEHKLFYCQGRMVHIDEWMKVEGEFVEPIFEMQQKIKRLNLTNSETAVLAALSMMFTDDCDLENAERVEQIQDFLLECLFYLFNKHHPHERLRFTRIINCLTELRNMREANIKSEEQIISIWWGNVHFPPLLCEVLPNPDDKAT